MIYIKVYETVNFISIFRKTWVAFNFQYGKRVKLLWDEMNISLRIDRHCMWSIELESPLFHALYITSIGLIMPQVCASLKPGPEFPSAYSLGIFLFSIMCQWFEDIEDRCIFIHIGWIIDHHYLNFLSMIGKCVIQTLIININRIRSFIFFNNIFV